MGMLSSLTRDDVLAGLGGGDRRRANSALRLIESSAARFTLTQQSVYGPYLTEGAFGERSRAYLGAIAESARDKPTITVQQLEHSVSAWKPLVPVSPRIRAEIARSLGRQYQFTRRYIPGIAHALGLDDADVQQAFEVQAGKPLTSIYADRLPTLENSVWAWARLSRAVENLPPFWTAFALTLTETVGAGTLALPIAFASVGPLPGVLVLIILGLINVLTVAYIAEASARNGSIRFGSAFVGRLVQDFLGTTASVVLRLSLFAFCCIVLASYYTGFASIVSAFTGIPAPVLVTVVFVTGLFLILRKSLLGTLASALLIGAINLSILLILSLVALWHANAENLSRNEIPFVDGRAFEPAHLQLVFGVVLVAYFGHLSVSNCAQAVLRRDPGGRSLKRGTTAAIFVAIAIYCLWSFTVGGAVDAQRLALETGTALVPLAEQVGHEIYLLGAVFAVLGLGMSSVHFGLGIFNLSRELTSSMPSMLAGAWFRRYATTLAPVLPIALVFGYVQWTYATGTQSFTAPLTLLGAILTPALAGVFPVLLLLASRAQGLPAHGARVSTMASHPLVLGLVVTLSFAGLLFHGLLIWDAPLMKVSALGMAAILLLLLVESALRGNFTPRLHIEVLHYPEKNHQARVSVTYHGEPLPAEISAHYVGGTSLTLPPDGQLPHFNDCETLQLCLPAATQSHKLVFNAFQVSSGFDATALEGEVQDGQRPFIAVARAAAVATGHSSDQHSRGMCTEHRVITYRTGLPGCR